MKGKKGIIILDFGSQFTQLIARRVRELGVYSEIMPHDVSLQELQKHQLVVNLASLILHDGKQDFNSENLKKVLKASGINVPEYWPDLVLRALEGKNLGDFLQVSGGGSSAPVGDNKA